MEPVNKRGPVAGYAIAATVAGANKKIYIQGGVPKRDGTKPTNELFAFDIEADVWTKLTSDESPSISFHSAYVADNRYITVVGGWNGKTRTSDVHVLDTRHETWLPHCSTSGFPIGAGLSSHTVTPLANGDFVVIGRLGGLRTQRKSSNVLLCRRLAPTVFEYSEMHLNASSRSGHTCSAATSADGVRLTVIGGRDGKDGTSVETLNLGSTDVVVDECCNFGHFELTPSKFSDRKYHSAISMTNGDIFVMGGESCCGKLNAEPLAEPVFLSSSFQWCKSPNFNGLPLTGHKAVMIDEVCYLVGGFEAKWRPNTNVYKLSTH